MKLIWIILGLIIMTLVTFLICLKTMSNSGSCDIGKPELVGDFDVIPETMYNVHACAIEDCIAFNKYHNETRCVV